MVYRFSMCVLVYRILNQTVELMFCRFFLAALIYVNHLAYLGATRG